MLAEVVEFPELIALAQLSSQAVSSFPQRHQIFIEKPLQSRLN
jgi:hypothetical protein